MINDCAFVGETILKYLPESVERTHVKRSRGLWSKTFGIALKIFGSKADVYHVNYLLQDCYLALKLGKKPLVGHAHGSDIRAGLDHHLWKRIVKYNLKNCDKILVSTPDILELARQYREDVIYLPNPVDSQLYYTKPMREPGEKLRILIASDSNWSVKGTDVAIRALSRIRDQVDVSIVNYGRDFEKTINLAKSQGLDLQLLPKVSHERVREYYWNADVVIDRFKLGSLGMISLEAIACGRPVVSFVSSKYSEYESFPLKDVDTEENIIKAINNAKIELWEKEYAYLGKNHEAISIVESLMDIYDAIASIDRK
ncbi:MAG: hypothetical protein QG670_1103 [Thermoproteota archaeon]|nr:hypothetical protein [Thermoproteota archaeon]